MFKEITSTREMSSEQYHELRGVSSTSFKQFLKSPAHFLVESTSEQKKSDAMMFGSLFHAMLLEGKKIHPRSEARKGSNEYKSEMQKIFDENPGALIYEGPNAGEAVFAMDNMKSSILAHPIARVPFEHGGVAEESFIGKIGDNGFSYKVRPDIYLKDKAIIFDIKTTEDASAEEFMWSYQKYKYWLSAAWYTYLLNSKFDKSFDFVIIAVEKKAPFNVCTYKVPSADIALGISIIEKMLPKLIWCVDNDKYPGYSDDLEEIGLTENYKAAMSAKYLGVL